MKEHLYSLLDEEFYAGLMIVTNKFRDVGLNPVLVGGTATQAHILDLLSEHGKRSIDDLVKKGEVSAREEIRPTDVYDMWCLGADREVIRKAVDSLDNYPVEISPDHSYHTDVMRNGEKRPIIRVIGYGSEATVRLNLLLKPKDLERLDPRWAEYFVKGAKQVDLKYGKVHLRTMVTRPEHLVAANLSRNSPNDLHDIHALINTMESKGVEFDYHEVKKVLGLECKKENPRCTDEECFELFPFSDRYESFIDTRKSINTDNVTK